MAKKRLLIVILVVLLTACGPTAVPTEVFWPTVRPTYAPVLPTGTPVPPTSVIPTSVVPTPGPGDSRWIDLLHPIAGDELSSPIEFTGRTNMTPKGHRAVIRLYGQNWEVLAETSVVIEGETGEFGTFEGKLYFSGYTGPAVIEVTDGEDHGSTGISRVTLVENP